MRFLALLFCALCACEGDIRPPPPAPPPEPVVVPPKVSACKPNEVKPGPAPIRRMTRAEYDNTVRDLLADDSHPAADFGAEEEAFGFNNNAAALTTSSALVDKQLAAAEDIAARLSLNLGRLPWFTCDPITAGAHACAVELIDAFGPRAYRRPITVAERDDLIALYERGASIGGLEPDGGTLTPFVAGVRSVIEAVLLSPDFLYRVEPVEPMGAGKLSPHAVAARLSYLLWGSLPDDALRAAADRGELSTPEQIVAQARRMLLDPRARARVGEFHEQWLDYGRIANVGKAAAVFPEWNASIGAAMKDETRDFIEHTLFDGPGTLRALLTSSNAYVSPALATFYGLQTPAFDPSRRGGLLTQGSLLTINAHSNQTSPVHRGKLVREAFLCETLRPPPPEIMITVPDPKPDSTARERFAAHSADPACSSCHRLMDPMGFGFENFDGVGRWRDTEVGRPIDASGQINGTDIGGVFTGAVGLNARLADSAQVRRCYVKQWFRWGYGRGEVEDDACTVERLEGAFDQSGGDVKVLIEALIQSDAFLYAGAP